MSRAAVYNIVDYGAVSDTTRLSTQAIQRAIDSCTEAGGGTVLVPAGTLKPRSIFLPDNVTPHLENRATLYGRTALMD